MSLQDITGKPQTGVRTSHAVYQLSGAWLAYCHEQLGQVLRRRQHGGHRRAAGPVAGSPGASGLSLRQCPALPPTRAGGFQP
nr:MAG TPA: hypothetical protein [Caudoviricetes sp.]